MPIRPTPRTTLAALALSAVSVAGLGLATAAPASAMAPLGDTSAGAVAHYSCGAHSVDVLPFSMTPLDGSSPVLAQAQVFDVATGSWLASDWITADGITTLTFSVTQPYTYAYVTYVLADGTASPASEYVEIQDDLDNAAPFC